MSQIFKDASGLNWTRVNGKMVQVSQARADAIMEQEYRAAAAPETKAPSKPRPPARRPSSTAKAAPVVSITDMAGALQRQEGLSIEDALRRVARRHPAQYKKELGSLPRAVAAAPAPEPEPVDIWAEIQKRQSAGESLVEATRAVAAAHPAEFKVFQRAGRR